MKKFLSGWIILVLAVVLFCGGRQLAKMAEKASAPEVDDNVIIVNGDVIRTAGLYASEDALWLIPQQLKKEAGELYMQYEVCRIDESGAPQFVAQFPGRSSFVWNEGDARFYYLSDETVLCGYDPATGTTSSQTLSENYSRVSAAEGNYIFLAQNPNGVLTMVSPVQSKETKLGIDGWILGAYSGRLLSWSTDDVLSCYDYLADELVWEADLSAYFSSSPTLCVSGGTLYLSGGTLPEVYAVPRFTEQFEWQKFPIKRSAFVSAMTAAEDYIICAATAVTHDKVSFFALYPNGDIVDIAKWQKPSYYRSGSILMETFNQRLYCIAKTEQELFSYDLLPQLDAGAPENSC